MDVDVSTKTTSMVKVVLRVAIDVTFSILVSLPVALMKVLGIEPFRRGFFCDDGTLVYPYKPFSDDIVPIPLLMVMTLIAPIVIISGNEIIAHFTRRRERSGKNGGRIWHFFYSELVVMSYKFAGLFLFGFMCNLTITMTIKNVLGRLRPHFLTVCKPNFTLVNCTDYNGLPIYIEKDICTGDPDIIAEARQSFPSGHSSIAMYAAVYISVYLYHRLHCSFAVLLRPVIQLTALSLGLFCCVSRVSDYKHHWTDVVAGGALGTVVALTTIFFVLDKPKRNQYALASNSQTYINIGSVDDEMEYGTCNVDAIQTRHRILTQT